MSKDISKDIKEYLQSKGQISLSVFKLKGNEYQVEYMSDETETVLVIVVFDSKGFNVLMLEDDCNLLHNTEDIITITNMIKEV